MCSMGYAARTDRTGREAAKAVCRSGLDGYVMKATCVTCAARKWKPTSRISTCGMCWERFTRSNYRTPERHIRCNPTLARLW